MRLFVVIPHYFGSGDAANSSPLSSSYLDPLSRIAALNDAIVSLHRNFGPYRNTIEGTELQPPGGAELNVIDIVILAMRDRHVLPHLGLDSGTYSVEYVEGAPTQIPFHAQRLMRDRLGQYDFYCVIEHDIAIHDPAFFEKLAWFQSSFGLRALLAPTRVETASTGTPGKVIVDPVLHPNSTAPFRREGQRPELRGVWNGRDHRFELPSNPHASCFFLTQAQLSYWVAQPTFDDGDDSWVGPIESAVTLGVGKAFDIYKCVSPDPFFLEVHHFGTLFASVNPPKGRRYGEPPLLAIAQNAMRVAHNRGQDGLLPPDMALWLSEGTMAEQVAQIAQEAAVERSGLRAELSNASAASENLEGEMKRSHAEIAALKAHAANLQTHATNVEDGLARLQAENQSLASEAGARMQQIVQLHGELDQAQHDLHQQRHSLRWLVRSVLAELWRRASQRLRGVRPAGLQ